MKELNRFGGNGVHVTLGLRFTITITIKKTCVAHAVKEFLER